MPSSSPSPIPSVISVIWQLSPRSVLDVGAGNGKYGVLFREYLEARHNNDETSIPGKRLVQIDAVEGFPEYVGELHRVVYDNVFTDLIQDFVVRHNERSYDFIYAGDVIEHIDSEDARNTVIPSLLRMSRMGMLISVPYRFKEQEAVYGNELERHRSHWTRADFRSLAPHSHVGRQANHLLAFLSHNREAVAQLKNGSLKRRIRSTLDAAGDDW